MDGLRLRLHLQVDAARYNYSVPRTRIYSARYLYYEK